MTTPSGQERTNPTSPPRRTVVVASPSNDHDATAHLVRIRAHVDRLHDEHPPLNVAEVDFTVRDPRAVAARYGRVLDYMARAELEVDRNVRELDVLLPDPPDIDRHFYREVWQPQELQHGLILDELLDTLSLPPSTPEVEEVSLKIRLLGGVAHLPAIQDVVRMLYYLTGMTTERSALVAYQHLHDGLIAMGEDAVASTAIAPIKRQEPGHFAYYQMSARELWSRLAPWQKWLVRRLRALSFAPVSANTPAQRAQVGEMMVSFGIENGGQVDAFAATVARLEAELLHAGAEGLDAPPYVADSFRRCLQLAQGAAA